MRIDLYKALNLWAQKDSNRFPHDIHPLDFPNGSIVSMTESEWEDWQWNPSQNAGLFVEEYQEQHLHTLEADDFASAKPTWRQLIDLLNAA